MSKLAHCLYISIIAALMICLFAFEGKKIYNNHLELQNDLLKIRLENCQKYCNKCRQEIAELKTMNENCKLGFLEWRDKAFFWQNELIKERKKH